MLEPEYEDGIRVWFLRKKFQEGLASFRITVRSDRAPTMITTRIVAER
jgi:hypothetical protein